MRALFYKDLCVLQKMLRIYVLFVALYTILMVRMEDSSFMALVLMLLFSMLPVTALTGEQNTNWGRFGQTMPVRRRTMVTEKYLLGLGSLALAAAVSIVMILAAAALRGQLLDWSSTLVLVGIGAAMCALQQAITLPLSFWLGAERGRFILIGGMVLVMLALGALGSWMEEGLPGWLVSLLASPWLLTAITVVMLAVLLVVSWCISVTVYRNKEFN